jgi:hypothetical protein
LLQLKFYTVSAIKFVWFEKPEQKYFTHEFLWSVKEEGGGGEKARSEYDIEGWERKWRRGERE